FKLGRVVEDEDIPGTLNVGHALPTLAEAFIYIGLVKVDMTTLVSMIASAVAGAYLGAGVVARWPRQKLQLAMGLLLLVAAAIIVLRQLALVPGGGGALGVSGARLAIGLAGNFLLGALMTLGIGLFAPCMILVSLLGMNADTAFPIMMGSCAFLMPVASLRFIRSGRYDLRAALGLTLGGVPAVLVAAYLVTSLPLGAVKWLVVVVVVYTAAAMLNSARQGKAVILPPFPPLPPLPPLPPRSPAAAATPPHPEGGSL
ncbi:MAG: sulfite exporter TauE/SafE family protein, partial [Polyangia bacterium]